MTDNAHEYRFIPSEDEYYADDPDRTDHICPREDCPGADDFDFHVKDCDTETFIAYRRSARVGAHGSFRLEIERDDATVYYEILTLAFGEDAHEIEREMAFEQFDDYFMRVHWREHGWPVREMRLMSPERDGKREIVARFEIEPVK